MAPLPQPHGLQPLKLQLLLPALQKMLTWGDVSLMKPRSGGKGTCALSANPVERPSIVVVSTLRTTMISVKISATLLLVDSLQNMNAIVVQAATHTASALAAALGTQREMGVRDQDGGSSSRNGHRSREGNDRVVPETRREDRATRMEVDPVEPRSGDLRARLDHLRRVD